MRNGVIMYATTGNRRTQVSGSHSLENDRLRPTVNNSQFAGLPGLPLPTAHAAVARADHAIASYQRLTPPASLVRDGWVHLPASSDATTDDEDGMACATVTALPPSNW
jgi:hypothetical protein